MDENRLVDIEVKLAHHEHALDEVNQVLTDQQAQLTHLEQVCQSLVERLRAISESSTAERRDEEKPPHY
ncbi:MAG: SlyX family protein [Woeseia sp.]